jgi:hypothetical protein
MKILVCFAVCFMAILSSCEDDVERTDFIIRVTKIEAPDSARVGESFSARFFGIIGPNGCFQLDTVSQDYDGNIGYVTFYGIDTSSPEVACTMMTTQLTQDNKPGYNVNFVPTSRGKFIISARQPDNTFFKDTVIVE